MKKTFIFFTIHLLLFNGHHLQASEQPSLETDSAPLYKGLHFSAASDVIIDWVSLQKFFLEKITENPKAKSLLESLLKEGEIQTQFVMSGPKKACYIIEDRTILLNVSSYTEISLKLQETVNTLSTDDDLHPDVLCLQKNILGAHQELEDFQKNYLLHYFIFETANAANKELAAIRMYNFDNGRDYARAIEIAEFNTTKVVHKISLCGCERYNWHKDVFRPSNIEDLKQIAYESEDAHFQFLVNEYNENWSSSNGIVNMLLYLKRKLLVVIKPS